MRIFRCSLFFLLVNDYLFTQVPVWVSIGTSFLMKLKLVAAFIESLRNIWKLNKNHHIFAETKDLLMKFKYTGEKLVKAIRTKRLIEKDIDVRAAAKEIGTSAPTLSRVENGSVPDLLTLASLCYWTGINIYDCIIPIKSKSKK